MKVAVFGASGFVGSALVRALGDCEDLETKAICGSGGSAWRLAQLDVEIVQADLLNRDSVRAALRDADAVVNCARGNKVLMLDGLKNLVEESKRAGIARFVHLSSVAVYGDPPPPESRHEDAPTRPERDGYGAMKLEQDDRVQQAHDPNGMQTVMLCPPNITGPGSGFLLDILQELERGTLPLLDDGEPSCAVVDTANLAAAAIAALRAPRLPGRRLFIVDEGDPSWRAVIDNLQPCLAEMPPPPAIDRATLAAHRPPPAPPMPSLWGSAKHLVSSPVREAIRLDPRLANYDRAVRKLVSRLPSVEQRLRMGIEGPVRVARISTLPDYNWYLAVMQLRGVHHACDAARREIGYRPVLTFTQSMERFRRWYDARAAIREAPWDLLRAL